ncbi:MAG TPA: hypothetical protein VFQ42_04140 [Mycobacterium sp.]|nr:hypothetical protein [Mycobacterium sp.]
MLEAAERRARVADLRRQRLTFTAIGKEIGVGAARAREIYREACAAILSPAIEALRAEHLAETAEARRRVMAVMRTDHYVVSHGHIVSEITGTEPDTLPDGKANPKAGEPIYGDPLVDHGPLLDAARTLIAIHAREMRLVGGDAPAKVEQGGQVRVEIVGVDPEELVRP